MSDINYASMKMPELRELFPEIKANNKRDFLRKIAMELEVKKERNLGNSIGRTGTVKATVSGKKEGIKKQKGIARGITPPSVTEDEHKGKGEGKPDEKKEKKVKEETEEVEVNTVLPDRSKEDRERLLKHKLVKRYLLSKEDLLEVIAESEDEIKIVVGSKKDGLFKCLILRDKGATKTVKVSRDLPYKNFVGSVD